MCSSRVRGKPEDIPRVQWHLGHVGYREDAQWPPAGSTTRSLYLHDLAVASSAGGALRDEPPREAKSGTWTFEPAALIPSAVENSWAFLFEYPDEADTAARDDVAVFDGEALAHDLDLAGPIDLWLRVSSTARTADVLVKLLDLAPDGTARMVARGQDEFIELPPNPGDGGNRWLATDFLRAEHTLHSDAARPARLDLTVLEAAAVPEV